MDAFRVEEIHAAEAPLLERGEPLMRRAAAALADHVRDLLPPQGSVLVVAGRGNNGGDGLHAAADLAQQGIAVTVLLAAAIPADRDGPAHGLRRAETCGARIVSADPSHPSAGEGGQDRWQLVDQAAAGADIWVDALTGIGLRPPAGGAVGAVLERLAQLRTRSPAIVVAVDIPSGLAADTGAIIPPVLPADHTVTFGCYKPALLLPPACQEAGQLQLVELGLELDHRPVATDRVSEGDLAQWWARPTVTDHKYTRGVVGVIAGSPTFPGAGVLCTGAAIRTGAGLVRYLGSAPDPVVAAYPEAVPAAGRVQAWVIGPGLDLPQSEPTADSAGSAMASGIPIVLDAGGLELLAPTHDGARIGGAPVHETVVLTPHAGELERLLARFGTCTSRAAIEADPAHWARHAAALTGATTVLKGHVTVIADPAGGLTSQAEASPWMATAGSGDVLAGILATVLAQHQLQQLAPTIRHAAAMACLVHGRAGHLASGGGPIAAGDIITAVPRALAAILAH